MNIVTLEDLKVEEIENILLLAQKIKSGEKKIDYNGQKVVANLFFEPSTRTCYSFQMAELRCGIKRLDFIAESSSLKKGESLYDTVKTFESFGTDAVVIRHSQDKYYEELIGKINIPILSGGDGKHAHPSQSLLDLFTIKEHFGKFDGLKVAFIGDIKHSRVAHSNIEVMKRLGMTVYTSGPEEYKDDDMNFVNFDKIIPEVDVVMLLRVQHERHEKEMGISKEEYHENYGMTMSRVAQMKSNAIIMHPAPFNRGVEIADDVVECEKSKIFRQVENGVFVRMAMLNTVLG